MTVEYIRYRVPGDTAELEQAYGRAARFLALAPQCADYELSRCTDEPTSYILRIEWDSADGHMQGFRRSPEFRTFFRHIQPYVGDIQEMRHYELTDVRSG